MIEVRASRERGHANHGWLDAYHTFSFGSYFDRRHEGFRALRVINEDRIQPGRGFEEHGHHDMEILTYVIAGELEHADSLGNRGRVRAGEIQRMSAGIGIRHSETNPSETERLHLLQIWILPESGGIYPGYEQRAFGRDEKLNRLRLVASGEPRHGALKIHQSVDVYASVLTPGARLRHSPASGRHVWVQIVSGVVSLNGIQLGSGDGAAASGEDALEIAATGESEFLLFDLP